MLNTAVDERNPATVDMVNIPLFTGFKKHARWLFGISSINSVTPCFEQMTLLFVRMSPFDVCTIF